MAEDVSALAMAFRSFTLILSFLACITLATESLYQEGDHVVNFVDKSLKAAIYDNERALLVEFYSSWCGHCQRFAPRWKELASDVRGWSTVILLGAVNCADEDNTDVCREFEIDSYPTLKFFPAHSKAGFLGTEVSQDESTRPYNHTMLDLVEEQSAKTRPKSWPNVHVLEQLEDIWQEDHTNVDLTVLIFEEPDSYLGKAVILDLSSHREILLRRVHKNIALKFGIKKMPSAYKLDKDGGGYHKIIEGGNRTDFVLALKQLAGIDDNKNSHEKIDNTGEVGERANCDLVHMQDLLSGLHYSFRQEMAGHKEISGEKLEALRAFMRVLSKYFPGPHHVVVYLQALHRALREVRDVLSGEQWLQLTYSVQTDTAYLPASTSWTGCLGSSPHFRGYPCSLWTLFHVLTAAAHGKLDKGSEPTEVLCAMRGYISLFFGCHECSTNFKKMAVTLEEEVHSTEDSILWLWRAHNRANKRLAGDVSEDPTNPKIQFPSSELCGSCRTIIDGKEVLHEPSVLAFLKEHYSSKKFVQDAKQSGKAITAPVDHEHRRNDFINWKNRKRELVLEGHVPSPQYQGPGSTNGVFWGFTIFDMSICVIFYMFCVLLLIYGYYHFMVRQGSWIRLLFFNSKTRRSYKHPV